MVKRVAIGGLQHESNSFAPVPALYDDFVMADGWPGLSRGCELFGAISGIHLPVTGAYDYFSGHGVECLPLLWAAAVPSAPVSRHAFETLVGALLEDLFKIKDSIDGVFLDLHGAMVCEHLEDGDGEIIRRVRDVVGDLIPISVSLDLHANVTPEMVLCSDYLDIFRTYPHVDMGVTGERAAEELINLMEGGVRGYKAFRQMDFVIPLCDGCTLTGAAQKFYEDILPKILARRGIKASAACGFPLSDIYHMGPSLVVYSDESQGAADGVADELAESMRLCFEGQLSEYLDEAAAIERAQQALAEKGGVIVIADVQDNSGGGGSADTTGLLRALLSSDVGSVLCVGMCDSACADLLHEHAVGDVVAIELGGRKIEGDSPLCVEAEILALCDGRFTATGAMWLGARMQLGAMALVRVGSVRIIIQSRPQQAADRSIIRHVGVEPDCEDIIVLKSSVHYRADFDVIAKEIILAKSLGAVYADISDLDFGCVRKSLKLSL